MAKKKFECPPCKQLVPTFYITWSDLVSLLMCLFVILFAMSKVDERKFDLAASSFMNAFNGVLTSLPTVAVQPQVLTPRLGGDAQNKRIAADVAQKIREVAKKENLEDAVKVQVTDMGVAIKISDRVSFDVGSDALKPEFVKVLEQLSEIVKESPGREIRIEGHTDNIPVNTPRFPSNWELSSSRALAVVKFLYNKGEDPKKLSGVGYGEFRPVTSNDTEAGRRENRRIEVYIEYLEKKDH